MTAQRKRRGRKPGTILRELRAKIRRLTALAGWTTSSEMDAIEGEVLAIIRELRAALKKGRP